MRLIQTILFGAQLSAVLALPTGSSIQVRDVQVRDLSRAIASLQDRELSASLASALNQALGAVGKGGQGEAGAGAQKAEKASLGVPAGVGEAKQAGEAKPAVVECAAPAKVEAPAKATGMSSYPFLLHSTVTCGLHLSVFYDLTNFPLLSPIDLLKSDPNASVL